MQHYFQFTEVINNINPEEKLWIEKDLCRLDELPEYPDYWSLSKEDREKAGHKFAKEHEIEDDRVDSWPDFGWGITDSVWELSAEENFNLDDVVTAVQRFIKRFRPDYVFTMTWSETCDVNEPGVFGGGCAVISANDFKTGNVWELRDDTLEAMRKEMACKKAKLKTKKTKKKP